MIEIDHWALGLLIFRALGMLALLPLGAAGLQIVSRLLLAVLLAVLAHSTGGVAGYVGAGGLLAEFLVGILLGLPVALVLEMASMLSEFFDHSRGQTLGSLYEPLTLNPESQLGVLVRSFLWANLVWAGTLDTVIGNYFRSLSDLPGSAVSLDLLPSLAVVLAGASLRIAGAAFWGCLPLLGVLLTIDLLAGLASRLLQHTSLWCEVFQLKTLIGLWVALEVWGLGCGGAALAVARSYLLEQLA